MNTISDIIKFHSQGTHIPDTKQKRIHNDSGNSISKAETSSPPKKKKTRFNCVLENGGFFQGDTSSFKLEKENMPENTLFLCKSRVFLPY